MTVKKPKTVRIYTNSSNGNNVHYFTGVDAIEVLDALRRSRSATSRWTLWIELANGNEVSFVNNNITAMEVDY